jgi:hypothetical protein
MPKRYILDLRGWKDKLDVYEGIDELPVIDGQNQSRYDVVEEEVDPDIIARLRKKSLERTPIPANIPQEDHEEYLAVQNSMPLGFTLLPPGVVLREA